MLITEKFDIVTHIDDLFHIFIDKITAIEGYSLNIFLHVEKQLRTELLIKSMWS